MRFQGDMKLQNRQKLKVIDFCLAQLNESERQAERESIAKIDEYRKAQKHMYRDIESLRQMENDNAYPDYDSKEAELKKMLATLESELMEIEVKLQQALKTSREKFFGYVTKSNDNMR